jgi:uncharacterized membrane protein
MTIRNPATPRIKKFSKGRTLHWLSRNWLLVFSIGYGLYVGIPFLAPVFMRLGWEIPAKVVYTFYSFLCHQLPQRSFFLFGQETMYSLQEIHTNWVTTYLPWELRQYIGSPSMGWKVAWSDRMVSMYTSILFFSWLWYPLRRKLKELPLWGFILMSLPMAIDGVTHLISDFAGIGQGFRDTNAWLAILSNNVFGADFYVGDALGSFNSWMRLVTGTLFGFGIVWFGFPYINEVFADIGDRIENRYRKLDELTEEAMRGISVNIEGELTIEKPL